LSDEPPAFVAAAGAKLNESVAIGEVERLTARFAPTKS
jgi:hypothetical protein